METRYDVFVLPPDGFPHWVTSAGALPEARKLMGELPRLPSGARYLVRDFL